MRVSIPPDHPHSCNSKPRRKLSLGAAPIRVRAYQYTSSSPSFQTERNRKKDRFKSFDDANATTTPLRLRRTDSVRPTSSSRISNIRRRRCVGESLFLFHFLLSIYLQIYFSSAAITIYESQIFLERCKFSLFQKRFQLLYKWQLIIYNFSMWNIYFLSARFAIRVGSIFGTLRKCFQLLKWRLMFLFLV